MRIDTLPLLVACALLAPRDASAQPGGPLETAVKFFEAQQAHRCGEAWRLYSARTQENIRAEVHRGEREREGFPQAEKPQERYCWNPGELKRGSARITRQQGNEAVAAADFVVKVVSDRRLLPHYMVKTEELRLIREAGAWRVERPRVAIGPGPGWRLTEVGPVDVLYQPGYPLRDQLQATVVVRAPRDTLHAALRDATFWARALPSIEAIRPMERTGELERVQLSFAGADRSLTVAVRTSSAPSSQASEAAVLWEVEGGDKAPVYFRGSWRLKPYSDGTRVTLHLVFNRKQWPGDVTEGMLSAERMAEAVLGLEKAALKAVP